MKSWILPAVLVVGGGVVIALTEVAAVSTNQAVGIFTKDPAATGNLAPYTGAVSMLDVSLWAVIIALAAVVSWLVPSARASMVPMGMLAVVLMADDALMLHEEVLPHHGIPETVPMTVYGVLGLLLLGQLTRSRRGTTAWWTLLLGGAALATSVVTDQVLVDAVLLEDGAKLLGILLWAAVPVLVLAGSREELSTRWTPTRASVRPSTPASADESVRAREDVPAHA